ncbi:MAG: hypothetical protein Q9227_002579 [Pyrenula ochraceoflavens]
MDSASDPVPSYDVVIVGTGFAGVYLIHKLRKLKFSVIAIDASSTLGGVWCQNTYPGCRVDIDVPAYSLAIDELLNTPESEDGWVWSERFPSNEELRRYFQFVDRKLGGISKHCVFDTWVKQANWDEKEGVWEVEASGGRKWKARFLLPCVGYAAKPNIPHWKGLDSFNGIVTHTAKWPKNGIDLRGKRVAVVGTGASGVQVIQTIAKDVKELTVFQQTPATAIPMVQRSLSPTSQTKPLSEWHAFYSNRHKLFDGASSPMIPRSAKSDDPSTRESEFSRLWSFGGFSFWASNYMDTFSDATSNTLVYAYWRDRVRSRILDPETAKLLAPDDPPYAFGTKRVPLEQTYYESFNLPHVHLLSTTQDPITHIDATTGPVLASGRTTTASPSSQLDILILATGFDVSTGSLTQLRMHNPSSSSSSTSSPSHPQTLSEKWSTAHKTLTYLGLCSHNFPNTFFPYGPQSPSFTCNGPLCAEIQGSFITSLLLFMRENGHKRVEAEAQAEEEWSEKVRGMVKGTLFEGTRSYYFGDNVVGKRRELVAWFGGVEGYEGELEGVRGQGWKGLGFR